MSREWNESLCGCMSDCQSCLCGMCCTPCLFGQNAEKIDGSNCVVQSLLCGILGLFYLHWYPMCVKRKALRQKYGLREDPCGDCPVSFCCPACALCQEARFLKNQAHLSGGAQPGHVGGITSQPRR